MNTFSDIQKALSSGKTTLVEVTRNYLQLIENQKHLNAFVEVYKEEALKRAAEIDEKRQNGTAGKLAGMVIGVKDNICVKGKKVTAASKILEGFESSFNATVIERLLAQDALIIGRLNCDEFAMGSSNEKSVYGAALNPHGKNRVPGGSSGASAAAVAAGLCTVSLGSDTGGSIRQPASFCGVVGLKPTYGRVSRYGLIAYGSSFDQIGPFANSVQDVATALEVMAGSDQNDSTCSTKKVEPYGSLNAESHPARKIAVIADCLNHEGLHLAVKKAMDEKIEVLKAKGHTVEHVKFDLLDKLVPAYHVLSNAEASSNLSRFDGMRYGYRHPEADDLESTYVKSRSTGFGKEVKRRIMMGTFVLSAGYYDAYYAKAQKVRRIIQDKTIEVFNDFDFMMSPTTPGVAFEIGAKGNDPVAMYLEDIFTVHANLTGNPAISVPLGAVDELPFGLQLMAPSYAELDLLQFASRPEITQN